MNPYQDMNFRFAKLMEDVASSWPAKDVAFIQELVAHSEYGEAVECLLALGGQNGKGFSARQSAAVAEICKGLGLDVPPAGAGAVRPPSGLAAKRAPHPG